MSPDQSSAEPLKGIPTDLWSSLPVQGSPLCYSVQFTLTTLVFLDTRHCLLNSGSLSESAVSPPMLESENSLKTVNLRKLQNSVVCLLSIENCYRLLSHVQSLEKVIFFFGCCRRKDNSPVTPL